LNPRFIFNDYNYNLKILLDKTKFLTGFINENENHWTCMICNLDKNELVYIDPIGENSENLAQLKKNWEYIIV
jgi:hypothetical protein